MITTNAPDVPGREIEVLGTVMGCAFGDLGNCGVRSGDGAAEFGRMMRSRGLDSFDVTSSKRVSAPQKLRLLHAIAEEGMVREAEALGADAVVCVRHTTSQVTAADGLYSTILTTEYLAQGTAVRFLRSIARSPPGARTCTSGRTGSASRRWRCRLSPGL